MQSIKRSINALLLPATRRTVLGVEDCAIDIARTLNCGSKRTNSGLMLAESDEARRNSD